MVQATFGLLQKKKKKVASCMMKFYVGVLYDFSMIYSSHLSFLQIIKFGICEQWK